MINNRSGIIPNSEFYERSKKNKLGPCFWRWEDIYSQLMKNPEEGISMVNNDTVDKARVLPHLNVSVQLLQAGKDTEINSHRHSNDALFVVLQGEGESIIGGEHFKWSKGDIIAAPAWLDHGHCNTSDSEDAMLLTFQNVPDVSNMGLWFIEEPLGDYPQHIYKEE